MAKTKYTDKPRYKAIVGFENDFKSQFSSLVKVMTKNIANKMKNQI